MGIDGTYCVIHLIVYVSKNMYAVYLKVIQCYIYIKLYSAICQLYLNKTIRKKAPFRKNSEIKCTFLKYFIMTEKLRNQEKANSA